MSADGRHPKLFSAGKIGRLTLRNRICLSPMGTNLESDDGTPGERITRFYEERARGGVGMVIVGVTGVAWPSGVSNPHNMGLSRDEFVPAFRELCERVHAHGSAIAVQLQHAGKTSLQDVLAGRELWVPSEPSESAGDLFDALAPEEIAAVTAPFTAPTSRLAYRVMDDDDFDVVCRSFADAAERACAAGFDGAEIHAGHGYLISSFLSPETNRRDDAWGGPLGHRARLLLRVIAAIRERVGTDFPLWCRLDGVEYRRANGIGERDARATARLAVDAGLDAIHVSAYADPRSAIGFTDAPLPHRPSAYLELARDIKREIGAPVIAVGRVDPDAAERALESGDADFVAWGRALIADPELPAKLRRGDDAERRCIYSYRCVGNVFLREATRCSVNPRAGREAEFTLEPAQSPRRVLVAGGGPGGLEAARLLAARGHRVTLCEREAELGGLARAAALVEPENSPFLHGLLRAIDAAKLEIRLGCEVTPALVGDLDPDAVVIAVGARRVRPPIPGADSPQVLDVWQLRDSLAPALAGGGRIGIVGGTLVAAELAERLAELGARPVVISESAVFAQDMAPPRRWRARHRLSKQRVALHLGARPTAFETGRLHWRDAEGHEAECAVDRIVLAEHAEADDRLEIALGDARAELHRVGDCVAPRSFEPALLEATRVALAL